MTFDDTLLIFELSGTTGRGGEERHPGEEEPGQLGKLRKSQLCSKQ